MTKKEIRKLVADCLKRDLTDDVVSKIEKKIDSKVQQIVGQCLRDEEQKEIDGHEKLIQALKKGAEKCGGRLISWRERFPWLYKTPKKRN